MTLTLQTRAKLFFCHTQLFNSTAMSGWTFRICNNFTTLSGDQAFLTWSTQLSRRHLRQYLWGMKCASWFWDMAIPNYYLHVHSVFFRLCWVAFMLHLLTSTMAGFWHKNVFKYILIVTYTIIQSITSSEMCSLHLTHPSAHTHLEQWAANAFFPSRGNYNFFSMSNVLKKQKILSARGLHNISPPPPSRLLNKLKLSCCKSL